MLNIKNIDDTHADISATDIDTFQIAVETDSYEEGQTLQFQISESETAEPIINKIFSAEDAVFTVVLTENEKNRLSLENYLYRMTLLDTNGEKITTMSGNLTMKWGA